MEATVSLRQPPAWPTVLQRQLALLLRSGRVLHITLAALAVLLLAELMSRTMAAHGAALVPLHMIFQWLWLIGLAWGIMIWSDEGPPTRAYHASLPTHAALHDATRVIAGALWLLAITALVLAVAVLLPAVRGAAAGAGDLTAAAWLNYFTAPLQLYLLLAIFSVAVRRPLAWFVGVLVGIFVTMLLASHFGIEPWIVLVRFVSEGPFGFGRALVDGFASVAHAGFPGRGPMPSAMQRAALEPGAWLLAVTIWLALLSAGVWLAASRRRIG
jgi:hypothetical protein